VKLTYKKSQRLCSSSQFRAVLSDRQSAGHGPVKVYVRPNQLSACRFGISVGKSAGSAVLRNRLKRLAREAFRLNQHNLAASWDYVLIISPKMTKKSSSADGLSSIAASYNEFEKLFLELAHKAVSRKKRTE
jgi:ribonuclease P protein component